MAQPQQVRDLCCIVRHTPAAGPNSSLRRAAEAALIERVDGEAAGCEESVPVAFEGSRVVVERVHGDDRRPRWRGRHPSAQRQARAILHDGRVLLEPAAAAFIGQRRLQTWRHARRHHATQQRREATARRSRRRSECRTAHPSIMSTLRCPAAIAHWCGAARAGCLRLLSRARRNRHHPAVGGSACKLASKSSQRPPSCCSQQSRWRRARRARGSRVSGAVRRCGGRFPIPRKAREASPGTLPSIPSSGRSS